MKSQKLSDRNTTAYVCNHHCLRNAHLLPVELKKKPVSRAKYIIYYVLLISLYTTLPNEQENKNIKKQNHQKTGSVVVNTPLPARTL